jgi:4-amino-4-deoxy-L-arabinose transferase-like glycosyltransferase
VDTLTEQTPDVDAAPPTEGRGVRVRRWVFANPVLVAIVVVGFALRFGWVLVLDPAAPVDWMISGDQYGYLFHGNEIAAGRGYHSYVTGEPTAYYPVGYPLLLAAMFWTGDRLAIPGDHMEWALLLNVAVSTASIVLAYLIGRRLFGRAAGLTGAAILALLPNVVYQVASTQLETMVIFWYLLAAAIIVCHDWSRGLPSTRRLVAFGLVLGAAVLVRPFALWFLPALLVAVLVAGGGWRRALRATLVPAALVVAVSVPWVIRNAISLDAFVPTSTNTGDTLCLDRYDGATGGWRWANHEGCAPQDTPEVERNTENTRMAASWVLHHPGRELEQIWRRGLLIFGSDHDGIVAVNTLGGGPVLSDSASYAYSVVGDVAFAAVQVLAAAGAIVLAATRRRRRPDVVFTLLAMASLIVVPLLLWGNPRFHLPVSPFFAILAGGAAALGVDAIRRRRAASG